MIRIDEGQFHRHLDHVVRDSVEQTINVVSCALDTDTRTGLNRRTGETKTRRLQRISAAHLRRLGRRYPREHYPRAVILIDNTPCHAGTPVRQALAEGPHCFRAEN